MLKSRKEIYKLGKFSETIVDRLAKSMGDLPKDLGKSIMDLLAGEEEEARPKPTADARTKYLYQNFYYWMEIVHSFERLYQAYCYLQKFPRLCYYNFYHVNELSWIRYHIEFFFQQNYIMNQRTVKWIGYLLDRAKHKPGKKATEVRLVRIRNGVNKGFADINRIRGQHVHGSTFEQRAFERAETAAHLATAMDKRGQKMALLAVKNLTLFEIARDWREKVHDNIESMFESYDLILGELVEIITELE